jgi:hypothetical protein
MLDITAKAILDKLPVNELEQSPTTLYKIVSKAHYQRTILAENGYPGDNQSSLAWARLRTDWARLNLLTGPVLTRYRPRLLKFASRALWGTTSDIARCPYLRRATG